MLCGGRNSTSHKQLTANKSQHSPGQQTLATNRNNASQNVAFRRGETQVQTGVMPNTTYDRDLCVSSRRNARRGFSCVSSRRKRLFARGGARKKGPQGQLLSKSNEGGKKKVALMSSCAACGRLKEAMSFKRLASHCLDDESNGTSVSYKEESSTNFNFVCT